MAGVLASPLPDGDLDLAALRLTGSHALKRATHHGEPLLAAVRSFLEWHWLGVE